MEFRPIMASLRKHKIPAILIVLEIALACAVFCNAVFMIGQRVAELHMPNVIDQTGIVVIHVGGTDPAHARADIPRNVAALRSIPGVKTVVMASQVPLGNSSSNSTITPNPGGKYDDDSPNVAIYHVGKGAPRGMGMELLRGRWFKGAEYADGTLGASGLPEKAPALVTRSLAERLWPDGNALGKPFWIGKHNRYRVVGVVADVLRPNQNGEGLAGFSWSAFFPVAPAPTLDHYIVRTSPRDRARVLRAATAKIQALLPNAVVKSRTFSDIRDQYFANTRSMVWILVLVCVVMLAVTAFGIVGLTSFWVQQRRRQIGIRRAVGATRAHILQYFQTENFLLSSAGVAAGVILAYGLNLYLMQHYQLNRMPWYYLPASAVTLWILGQLAVLAPALRASHVPPVVATRSV